MLNSCKTKRGCSVTIILPHGGRPFNVSSRSVQRNTKKILSLVKLPLDKELAKAA